MGGHADKRYIVECDNMIECSKRSDIILFSKKLGAALQEARGA